MNISTIMNAVAEWQTRLKDNGSPFTLECDLTAVNEHGWKFVCRIKDVDGILVSIEELVPSGEHLYEMMHLAMRCVVAWLNYHDPSLTDGWTAL